MTDTRTIFADGILEGSVTHGVVRLTLAQTAPDGKPVAAGQLVMPLVQMTGFVNGLVGLLRQVEARLKEAQQQGAAAPLQSAVQEPSPPAEAGDPAAQALGGSFRFGSG